MSNLLRRRDVRTVSRLHIVGYCLLLLAAGAKPATQPTTKPAAVSAAEKAVKDAEIHLRKAEAACITNLSKTTEYQEKKAAADAAERKLEQARQHGTPQERLQASHDFIEANEPVKELVEQAKRNDPDVSHAKDRLLRSQNELAVANATAVAEQHAAAERAANDPIQKAIREHKVVKGMSRAQVRQSLDHLRGKAPWTFRMFDHLDDDGNRIEEWQIGAMGLDNDFHWERRVIVFYAMDGIVKRAVQEMKHSSIPEPDFRED